MRGNSHARCGVGEKLEMISKTYLSLCKEGSEIINDNTQLTIFGGFAPNSESAQVLSKAMGSRTVQSGSVSRGKNDPSQSIQMIERTLMTPDELKSMPKGQFVVMKTGFYPMIVKLKLFFKWGIKFGEEYTVADKGNRKVAYAGKDILQDEIFKKYHSGVKDKAKADDDPLPGAPASEDIPVGGQKQYPSNRAPSFARTPIRQQNRGAGR